MEYLNATKIHGVISPALHNEIASGSSLNDISMSPELLQMDIKRQFCKLLDKDFNYLQVWTETYLIAERDTKS